MSLTIEDLIIGLKYTLLRRESTLIGLKSVADLTFSSQNSPIRGMT